MAMAESAYHLSLGPISRLVSSKAKVHWMGFGLGLGLGLGFGFGLGFGLGLGFGFGFGFGFGLATPNPNMEGEGGRHLAYLLPHGRDRRGALVLRLIGAHLRVVSSG